MAVLSKDKIKLGIPKGSLQEHTLDILKSAGFNVEVPERGYFLRSNDPEMECFLLRPQEIPTYVEKGKLDAGISGADWIADSKADVFEICDLKYAKHKINKVKWVLVVPEGSQIKSVKDLQGKLIATEAVNLAKDYLKKNKVKARVEFSWGATEAKPPRFADAAIDLTETGASLEANKLKILDVIFESSTKFFANKKSLKNPWKKEKIGKIGLLLKGAVDARDAVGIAFHVHRNNLAKVLKSLPSSKKPTVNKITDTEWYDIFCDIPRKKSRDFIPQLIRLGCEGIVEFPLRKLVV